MRIKSAPFYLENYIRYPFIIIHELSHWVFALFGYMIGLNTFPTIHITRNFKIEEYNDDPTQSQIWGTSACIMYRTSYTSIKSCIIHCAITASAPMFSTILLFLISPWWLYPLYLSNISTMWISWGDYEDIKKLFNKP